ncbi:hypothetical protein [Thermoflexus hugenholtzii]
MLRTRCPYCGRPFSVSREEAAGILAQALAENARYGMRECPFCRRRVKIGLAELRRVAPTVAPAGAESASPAPEAAASPSPEPPAGMEAPVPEPEEEAPPAPTPRGRRKRTGAAPSGPRRSQRRTGSSSPETEVTPSAE